MRIGVDGIKAANAGLGVMGWGGKRVEAESRPGESGAGRVSVQQADTVAAEERCSSACGSFQVRKLSLTVSDGLGCPCGLEVRHLLRGGR